MMPRDVGDYSLDLLMWLNIIIFCLHYFDFWPNTIAILLLQLAQMGINSVIKGQPITNQVLLTYTGATI